MDREFQIHRFIYLVDDETRIYRFLRRNPDWRTLDSEQNERIKRHIDGYARVFRDGQKKTFRYHGS